MTLHLVPGEFCVCLLDSPADLPPPAPYTFTAVTGQEVSLVCPKAQVPQNALQVEAGHSLFYVGGTLDFSLVGILARLSGVLAGEEIPLFAISTYNTDYILIKEAHLPRARQALTQAGYTWAE